MPVKGLDQVRKNLAKELRNIKGTLTEKALQEVLIVASGYAATMTPIDTSNLINSQVRQVWTIGSKVVGSLSYTAAYAAAVHDAKGTLKGTNTPRSATNPSRGNVWDPDAEPEFLRKAFEDSDARRDIDATIERHMKLK
jgi:hypothetical protein